METSDRNHTARACVRFLQDDWRYGPPDSAGVNPEGPAELVLDKGYHSNDALVRIKRSGVRTYCSEPKRVRRKWKGKTEGRAAVYASPIFT